MAGMTPEERVAVLAERLLASLDLELVEIEYKREGRVMVLRVYIDKQGGVNSRRLLRGKQGALGGSRCR